MSFSLVPESVRDITQGEALIDDRRDLAGFDELLQNTQVLCVVPSHRANILTKLGMRDRVDLTRYAIRRGLVQA